MITQEYLKECLHYDPETGVFTWLKRPLKHFKTINSYSSTNTMRAGTEAGAINSHGYCHIRIDGVTHKAHRLAWLYTYGRLPVKHLDHINHFKTDNRIENLREVTRSENGKNVGIPASNTSGYLGIDKRKDTGKWRVRLKIDGKQKNIGSYETLEQAVRAWEKAKNENGYHENHGR